VPETSRTLTEDIEDRLVEDSRGLFGLGIHVLDRLIAGAVGAVGNAGVIGVFQELWEGVRFSARLSIARQIP
jgi:hypothetical protein